MKKLLVLLSALLLWSANAVYAQPSNPANLDNEKGTSMRPVFAEAIPIIEQLEDRDLEIVRLEFDIIFDEKTAFRQLYSQWEYGIIAFGDYRIEDIDISVYKEVDGQWTLIAKDEDADQKAGVTVQPSFDGFYRIDVKVYKFRSGYTAGRFGIVVFHE